MHSYSNLKPTHEILMQLVQTPREPVVVDVHVEIVWVTVACSTMPLGHDHPCLVHDDPFPFGMLGGWLAVYWHAAIFIILQGKFVSSPRRNDHAHVLVRVNVFLILVGLFPSAYPLRWETHGRTAAALLPPSDGLPLACSDSLRADEPSPVSSWRWALQAGSRPAEPCSARFLGGIAMNLQLDIARLVHV